MEVIRFKGHNMYGISKWEQRTNGDKAIIKNNQKKNFLSLRLKSDKIPEC